MQDLQLDKKRCDNEDPRFDILIFCSIYCKLYVDFNTNSTDIVERWS